MQKQSNGKNGTNTRFKANKTAIKALKRFGIAPNETKISLKAAMNSSPEG